MRDDSRISEGPDYSVTFDNFVGMKTAGRNAGCWQARVLKSADSPERTKMMVPAEVAFGEKQRKAAENWRADYDSKIASGSEVAANTVTLAERLDRYERQRQHKRPRLAQKTLDIDRYAIRPIRQHFGNARLQSLKKDDYEDFMSALLAGELTSENATSSKAVKEKGELGGSQARQSLRILKKVLEDAFDNDLVRKNYARSIEVPVIVKQRRVYLVQFPQVAEIVAAAQRHCTPRWVPGLFAFWGYTGARKMEGALQLRADINPMKKTVLLDGTKTRSARRMLDYNDQALADLWTALEPHLVATRPSSDYLFATFNGTPPASNVQRYLDVACREAGLARLTPHMFRHSFATSLIYAGVPIPEVARIMGHKNSQVTMTIYAHCWDEAGHLTYEWPESIELSEDMVAA